MLLLAPALSLASVSQERLESSIPGWQDDYRRGRLGFRQCPADEGPIYISEISYTSLNTFAGVAHAQCFQKDNDGHGMKRYDIAVLGTPLDTTVTGRPGARYGPSHQNWELQESMGLRHVHRPRSIEKLGQNCGLWRCTYDLA